MLYDAPPSPVPEIITYNKDVQTMGTWTEPMEENHESVLSPEKVEEVRQRLREEIEEELRQAAELKKAEVEEGKVGESVFARELSEEEKSAIMTSNDFLDFFERSSKVVERALDMEYDVLADYGSGVGAEDDDQAGRRLKEVIQFYDERWSKKRQISDLHFSPKVRLLW